MARIFRGNFAVLLIALSFIACSESDKANKQWGLNWVPPPSHKCYQERSVLWNNKCEKLPAESISSSFSVNDESQAPMNGVFANYYSNNYNEVKPAGPYINIEFRGARGSLSVIIPRSEIDIHEYQADSFDWSLSPFENYLLKVSDEISGTVTITDYWLIEPVEEPDSDDICFAEYIGFIKGTIDMTGTFLNKNYEEETMEFDVGLKSEFELNVVEPACCIHVDPDLR